MPKTIRKTIVINTSPLIAIVAATGELTLLEQLNLQTIFPTKLPKKFILVGAIAWELKHLIKPLG